MAFRSPPLLWRMLAYYYYLLAAAPPVVVWAFSFGGTPTSRTPRDGGPMTHHNDAFNGRFLALSAKSDDIHDVLDFRREIIQENCQLFSSSLSNVQQDFLALHMKQLQVDAGSILIQEGSTEKSIYLVQDGQLMQVVDDDIKGDNNGANGKGAGLMIGPGQTVGEMAYFSMNHQAKQPFTIVATKTSHVWKLDQAILDLAFASVEPQQESAAAKALVRARLESEDESYRAFMEQKERTEVLSKISFLKGITKSELNSVADSLQMLEIQKDQLLIQQGSAGEDTMYIVKEGSFDCFRTENRKQTPLTTYSTKGDYFGELALFFRKPRAASVQCVSANGGKLWKLDRESLFEALSETRIGEDVYQLIQDTYRKETWLEKAVQLSVEDWYDLAVVQSRPQKKAVSFHSIVATLSLGATLPVLISFFDPQWVSADGMPQIFRYNTYNPPELLRPLQAVAVLQSVTSVLGFLRIPPNSPRVRRLGFGLATSVTLLLNIVSLSILSGVRNNYLLDAFSGMGRLYIGLVSLWLCYNTLSLVDCSISDAEMKGFDSIPSMDTRAPAILVSLLMAFSAYVLLGVVLPVSQDLSSFEKIGIPFFENLYPGSQCGSFVVLSTWVGLQSFVATLQFERKITPTQGLVAFWFQTIFLGFDAYKLTLLSIFEDQRIVCQEEAATLIQGYYPELYERTHFVEIYIGAVVLTILNALRKVAMQRRDDHAT